MRPEPHDRCEAQGRRRPSSQAALTRSSRSRRPDCSPRGLPREAGQSTALAFTIRVLPLEGPEVEKIRERQLAVIVRLLQHASAQTRQAQGGSE
jgi:hypothetical protein